MAVGKRSSQRACSSSWKPWLRWWFTHWTAPSQYKLTASNTSPLPFLTSSPTLILCTWGKVSQGLMSLWIKLSFICIHRYMQFLPLNPSYQYAYILAPNGWMNYPQATLLTQFQCSRCMQSFFSKAQQLMLVYLLPSQSCVVPSNTP